MFPGRLSVIILAIFLTVIARDLTAAYTSMTPSSRTFELFVQSLVSLVPMFGPSLITIVWAAIYELRRQWQSPGIEALCIVLVPWTLFWINMINSL